MAVESTMTIDALPPLEDLGNRIMICGPSNSGKSTLAAAVGRKLGLPTVHLDQFYHVPNTDWVPRPREEFVRLHDAAILEDAWVMDGNYSALVPQRLARATGLIVLHDNRFANFARYLRRTLFQQERAGQLEGARDSIKWNMIQWILIKAPRKLRAYYASIEASGLPYVRTNGMGDVKRLYARWGLSRWRTE
jgi:adenylate kinase family enzyme